MKLQITDNTRPNVQNALKKYFVYLRMQKGKKVDVEKLREKTKEREEGKTVVKPSGVRSKLTLVK